MNEASSTDVNLARLLAVEAEIKAGNFQAAAAALDALAAQTPADVRVHLAASSLGRAAGNARLEIQSLRRAVAAAPASARVGMELAKALSRHGRHAEAVATVHKALQLAPDELAVLEAAVAIADVAGNLEAAQQHLQRALALRPSQASIRRALGRNLARQGRCAEAEPHLRAILAMKPDDLPALKWLGSCLIDLKRNDEALALLQKVEVLDPADPSLPYYLELARGQTPSSTPPDMVRGIFDDYAHRFDAHLLGKLEYRVPQHVAQIIRQRAAGRDADVLDLGCGTGLVGKHLGRMGNALVGVDMSPAMIGRAARLGVYTELRQGALLDQLRLIPPASFDYVIAADVFIYVGDIAEVIPACFTVLRSGGALIFSCETADSAEGGLVLRPSKRYAHSTDAVEALCRAAGFERCAIEPMSLRLENNAPVAGFIAVAEKYR